MRIAVALRSLTIMLTTPLDFTFIWCTLDDLRWFCHKLSSITYYLWSSEINPLPYRGAVGQIDNCTANSAFIH